VGAVSAVTQQRPAGQPPGDERREIRLGLLRGFELQSGGMVVELPRSAQRLLAFLALQDRPLQRAYVAGTLWTDSSEEHSHASLRSALWRLKRPGCALVDCAGAHLRISGAVVVDYRQAADTAHRIVSERESSSLEGADTVILGGDLLPDWYEEWLIIERERLRQLRLHALEILCRRLTAVGNFGHAVVAGLAAVHVEPLRESAHRVLIEVHLAEGNRIEALRQFQTYQRLVRSELGLEPSASLAGLVR
jgi:DNA-binding SARP family transcriptional activator